MSLIHTDLRHEANVYPEITYEDSRGNTVKGPAAQPVTVRCNFSPVKQRNDLAEAQANRVEYKFYAREAPLGIWSKVVWQGREFIVSSGPYQYDRTSTTSHIEATLNEVR